MRCRPEQSVLEQGLNPCLLIFEPAHPFVGAVLSRIDDSVRTLGNKRSMTHYTRVTKLMMSPSRLILTQP